MLATKEAVMPLVLMIVVGILVVTALVVVALRNWGKDVERTETELHEPGARWPR